jgi:pre-rRNA-processing protein TSR3
LKKFRIAKGLPSLKQIPSHSVVLNPTARQTLTKADRSLILSGGLVGLDCSWNRSDEVFDREFQGQNRRLPTLLAGNPTSYAIPGRLSTAEAIAAALFITGFDREARRVLSLFHWGETFISLNKDPIREYSRSPPEAMAQREREFFGV